MKPITIYGVTVLVFMMSAYAFESRGRRYVLAFALGCALSSVYGFLAGTWPFGAVETVWCIVALRRFVLLGHERAVEGVALVPIAPPRSRRPKECRRLTQYSDRPRGPSDNDGSFGGPADKHGATSATSPMRPLDRRDVASTTDHTGDGVVLPVKETTPMEQRVSLITLGVADVGRARAFYDGLGWEGESPDGDVVFYQAGGIVVALWGRAQLAADSTLEDGGGWGGVTLAYNVTDRRGVDDILERAEAAGGRIGRRGAPTSWGGYSGVFIDPDGHPWEVAHNPTWVLEPSGEVRLHPRTGAAIGSVQAPRSLSQREADTVAKLSGRHTDVWVASSQNGSAHLVPLSFAWCGDRIVLVTHKRSRTARNLAATRRARLCLGPTRDVVVIDAELDEITDYDEARPDLVTAYLSQADWDPAQSSGEFVMIVLRPVEMQAWREAGEIPERVVMHRGEWCT